MTYSQSLSRKRRNLIHYLRNGIEIVRPYAAPDESPFADAVELLAITRKWVLMSEEHLALVEIATEHLVAAYRPRMAHGKGARTAIALDSAAIVRSAWHSIGYSI